MAELVVVDDPRGPLDAKSCFEIATNGGAPTIVDGIHDTCAIERGDWPVTAKKRARGVAVQGTLENEKRTPPLK